MNNFKQLVEKIIDTYKLKENGEQVIYKTYMDKPYLNNIIGSSFNKPLKGLWGCRDDSWKEWCTEEDYPCSDKYFEWVLKPGTKVYTIDTENDFIYLLKKYGNYVDGHYIIDFMKVSNDYDAVELTENGNANLHWHLSKTDDIELQDPKYEYALNLSLNFWDVPSICVFKPSETVTVIY